MKNKVFVLGCGNPLFGDDGFGPAFIDYFNLHFKHRVGPNVEVIDMGTAVRDFLFDILLFKAKPKKIIIVDAHTGNFKPGEITQLDLDEISPKKISDFSLHQFPTINLLKELKQNTSVEVKVFVVQTEFVPDKVLPGLSNSVSKAIPKMCEIIIKECEE
ncbi:coenzyme F420-reducing hydrogenase, FrhD protein [Desulfothermus okinawensis JCM 13304]